jgi:DNA-binding response OmpR family regulator
VTTSVLIFIVEDEKAIWSLLEDALTDGGFAVAGVVTGEEAMATLNARGADFSALVTDINLPGNFSGWRRGQTCPRNKCYSSCHLCVGRKRS